MNFIFMLTETEPLFQKSISVAKDWDYISQADSDQISEMLREIVEKWVREAQQHEDDDLAVHKILASSLAHSAVLTGDQHTFNPAGTTDEQYDAMSVMIWGAVVPEIQYPATLSDLKASYETTFLDFKNFEKENDTYIPEEKQLRAYCADLTAATIKFFDEMMTAYQYFILDKRETDEMKVLVKTLLENFLDIDALITTIRKAALPKNWERTDTHMGAVALEDVADDEVLVYGEVKTIDFADQAEATNNAAWSILQYVTTYLENKKL